LLDAELKELNLGVVILRSIIFSLSALLGHILYNYYNELINILSFYGLCSTSSQSSDFHSHHHLSRSYIHGASTPAPLPSHSEQHPHEASPGIKTIHYAPSNSSHHGGPRKKNDTFNI
jgi:hypothetical protein